MFSKNRVIFPDTKLQDTSNKINTFCVFGELYFRRALGRFFTYEFALAGCAAAVATVSRHRERQPVQPPICEQWGDKRHYFEPRSSIAPFKGDVLIIMIGRGLQLGQLAVTSYGNR